MKEYKESLNIVYLGGIWPTNIGNAFIDLGSIHSLKKASPDSNVHFIGGFTKTLFSMYGKDHSYVFDLLSKVQADYIVLSGNFDDYYFINILWPIIKKTGAKLIINGMGGATYRKKEVLTLRAFFKDNPPYALISRDEKTFIYYSGLAEHSYNGIDCGFFLSDYFKPVKLDMPEFIIHNFDKIKASDYVISPLSLLMQAIRIKFHRLKNQSGEVESVDDQLIIRTHHACLPYVSKDNFCEQNTLISAIPEDYLNLYANTKATYSNRVHACVATLAFNNPARLFNNTPRAALFDRIGANKIRQELTYPDSQKIHDEKSKQIKFLSKIL